MQYGAHPECIPTTIDHSVPKNSQAFIDDCGTATVRARTRAIYFVAACRPPCMVVLREVHAAWKSARTRCNDYVHVCEGFHVIYIHNIHVDEEEKISIPCIICMTAFVSRRGGGEMTSFSI